MRHVQAGSIGKQYPGYIPLKVVKYKQVHCLTFFFEDNNGADKTYLFLCNIINNSAINRIILFGVPKEGLNMANFNKGTMTPLLMLYNRSQRQVF